MTARYFATLIALFLALSSSMASARDPSIGLCTRKDDFVAKLELIDPLVQKLTAAKEDRERDGLAAKLAETYGGGTAIECLIRYREPEMAEVFVKLLDHERWPIRARALYGLKMVGAQNHVAEVARLLDDPEPQVREQAASTLGHLGGEAAIAALKQREPDEENAYVRATIAASLELAALDEKPYARLSKQAEPWSETLVGPEGARRVEWQWVVKGKNSFNDYDAKAHEVPVAKEFCYPVSWYKDCLFSGVSAQVIRRRRRKACRRRLRLVSRRAAPTTRSPMAWCAWCRAPAVTGGSLSSSSTCSRAASTSPRSTATVAGTCWSSPASS